MLSKPFCFLLARLLVVVPVWILMSYGISAATPDRSWAQAGMIEDNGKRNQAFASPDFPTRNPLTARHQ
jgi:hypothetical protein